MEYVLYTFESTNDAMMAEIKVKSKGVQARLVPLLPEIDAGCGLALRFDKNLYKEVNDIFTDENLKYEERYILLYKENERKPQVKNYDLL